MLSEKWLVSMQGKPRAKVLERADRDGLSVRVSTRGKVVFQMRYRLAGKPHRLDIGVYPIVPLDEARETALRLSRALREGKDPKPLLNKSAECTVRELIREWYTGQCVHAKQSHAEVLRSLELYVLPELGDRPADAVRIADWERLLVRVRDAGGVEGRGAPQIANRLLTNVRQAYKWGVKRELTTQNPLRDYSARHDLMIAKNHIRGGCLPDDEIRVLWLATERSRMSRRTKLYIYLSLFYGCRPGEIRDARRDEFDFEHMLWTIPPSRHKTGSSTRLPLVRPIIPQVLPLLREAMTLSNNEELVFSNEGDSKPLNDRATLSFSTNIKRAAKNRMGVELQHFSMLYDLRKTARTNWSTITPPHVAELMLGHKLPGVWQVYDRYDYLPEMTAAYTAWWERLQRIVYPDHP